MARKVPNSLLESRSSRLKLAVRRRAYSGSSLGRGISLLYRRNKTNGSWALKATDGHGQYWTKAFALADDYDASDGKGILDFYQAQDVAKQLARRQPGEVGDDSRPVTVAEALDAYEADLITRGGSVHNAKGPRKHLTSVLKSKPVQLLDAKELNRWRNSLLDRGLQPSSVVRYCKGLRAALSLAASHDARILNKSAWQVGLEALPDATVARNVILDDRTVGRFINAAYAHDPALGLLVHVIGETGARPSQVARLLVEDLQGGARPRLTVPRSAKANGDHTPEPPAAVQKKPKFTDLAIEDCQKRFEAGDPKALIEAMDYCARSGTAMPMWLGQAVCDRFDKWFRYEAETLDEAFEVKRKGERVSDRKRRLWLQPRVAYEVLRLHRDENLPIDEALFERVGKTFNIKAGMARDIHYNANRWRRLFEVMPTKPPSE